MEGNHGRVRDIIRLLRDLSLGRERARARRIEHRRNDISISLKLRGAPRECVVDAADVSLLIIFLGLPLQQFHEGNK